MQLLKMKLRHEQVIQIANLIIIEKLHFYLTFSHTNSLNLSSDENDCNECEEVLKELERIDDDADDLDIMFVKIKDTRFSRKYGIAKVPALAFFRKRFPSMYRGWYQTSYIVIYANSDQSLSIILYTTTICQTLIFI